jgi:hypothetical protein
MGISKIIHGHFSFNLRSVGPKRMDFYAATAIWQIALRRKAGAYKEITPL